MEHPQEPIELKALVLKVHGFEVARCPFCLKIIYGPETPRENLLPAVGAAFLSHLKECREC